MRIKTIKPIGKRKVFNTNVKENHNFISKGGIINHNCVVDSQYRGIVHVHLTNLGERPVTLEKGDKISQFLVFPVWTGVPSEKKVEIDSERGEDGFGSTDKK